MSVHNLIDEMRLAKIQQTLANIDDTLQKIEKRFDKVDIQLTTLRTDSKDDFKEVNSRINSVFVWAISGFTGILVLIARSNHWI